MLQTKLVGQPLRPVKGSTMLLQSRILIH